MPQEPSQFRARYQNLLDVKKARFAIKVDSDDPWGVIITTRNVSWVQVWHNLQNSTLTLGLWGEGRNYIGDARPLDATFEDTGKFLMFRWEVPKVDGAVPPHEQSAMDVVINRIKDAFDWVRENRIDLT